MLKRDKSTNTSSIILLLMMISLTHSQPTITDRVDDATLLKQNAECNSKRNLGKEACASTPSCCFFQYYEPKYETQIPMCIGINIFKQLHLSNELEYLRRLNMSNLHSSVKTGTFCQIVAVDPTVIDFSDCSCFGNAFKMVTIIGLVFAAILQI